VHFAGFQDDIRNAGSTDAADGLIASRDGARAEYAAVVQALLAKADAADIDGLCERAQQVVALFEHLARGLPPAVVADTDPNVITHVGCAFTTQSFYGKTALGFSFACFLHEVAYLMVRSLPCVVRFVCVPVFVASAMVC
jgi:hypothetical protein